MHRIAGYYRTVVLVRSVRRDASEDDCTALLLLPVPHPSIEIHVGIPIEIWIYLDLIMWLIKSYVP